MTGRKKTKKHGKTKKKKEIPSDDFARKELIQTVEGYKEITKEKKKKDKMKEAKNLDLWAFKIIILLDI